MARLGDVCKLVSGNSLPETIVAENGELPYVKVAELNLTENIPNITTSRQFVSVENISAKQIVPVGTVIFPKRGGAIGTNKKRLVSTPICMDLNLMGVIPSSKLYPQYLYYFFENIDMGALSNGSSVPQINNSDIAPLEIRIPDITTQKDIAIRLDKVNELIALRKEQLAKLDQLVKSRFIELFGHPVANEMCWTKVPLSACVESIDNGKSFVCDTEARQGEWPAVLKLSAATYGFYRPEENKALLDENQFVENAAVHAGDLLFTRKNTPELVGMCAYVYDSPNGLMMPDLIFRLNTTEGCNKIFLWKLINHDLFRGCVQTIATGSAKSMSNISKERLLNLEIILPPLELQEQFAAFVEQTDKSKLAIQQSLDKQELLKKSLMQEYFG